MKRAIQYGASTGNAETDATVQKWKLKGKLMRAVPFAKVKGKALKGAGDWPQGKECDSYIDHSAGSPMNSAAMIRWASSNSSLLAYLYPQKKPETVEEGWQALLPGCRVVPSGCWCFHVAGSMVKADNPRGAERCVPKDTLMNCMDPAAGAFHMMSRRNCSCFAQRPAAPPCLFGDMRPAKLLAIISACRAAGVTHIIEQGRYGGLSAYMYALHGFKVTSVELLPLVEVSAAMRTLAPQLTMVDADGRASVIKLVNAGTPLTRRTCPSSSASASPPLTIPIWTWATSRRCSRRAARPPGTHGTAPSCGSTTTRARSVSLRRNSSRPGRNCLRRSSARVGPATLYRSFAAKGRLTSTAG